MKNKPCSEKEIAVAIDAYFQLMQAQPLLSHMLVIPVETGIQDF